MILNDSENTNELALVNLSQVERTMSFPNLPKTFNPLLLTIGFIIFLIGLGYFGFAQDPRLIYAGFALMLVAIYLEIRKKHTSGS